MSVGVAAGSQRSELVGGLPPIRDLCGEHDEPAQSESPGRPDLFDHGIWSIERQKVSGILNRHELSARYVMLTLTRPGSILGAPNKAYRHANISIGLSRRLPACGIA